MTRFVLTDEMRAQRVFYNEVKDGLDTSPRHLSSKFFYDKKGDVLFQKIMHCPEYYLFRCELEILSRQAAEIGRLLKEKLGVFNLIELGAGDATKSIYLLKELTKQKVLKSYFPVDISSHVIAQLEATLPAQVPGLQMKGFNGEYLKMIKKITSESEGPNVVLFLGANIGNFTPEKALQFCVDLGKTLKPGDLLLTGFDLKKDPQTILNAYNDRQGLTKAFNLNLLDRINKELIANFDPTQFDHFPTYDPETGTCKSFLVSRIDQSVSFANSELYYFKKNETIHTETSQKYLLDETDRMAEKSGFRMVQHFMDEKKWFVDSLWQLK